ncbi:hypothetical protein F5Y16DRAFT_103762 [Xylariaceae sp. FL0255]|nr:hypothetical protein F5Y16DRAFT_103762 [Xylariaceae sp. FL0255]
MPLMPNNSLDGLRRQTWPLSQVLPLSPSRFPPALEEDSDGMFTDEDDNEFSPNRESPLKYFLTPATPGDEELEFDFDFDAGIEDSNCPRENVRSISPSTLDGLKKYKPRSKIGDCAILDDDDDDEDYIRFTPHKNLPYGLDDYLDHSRHGSPEGQLSPNSFHVGSPKGQLSNKHFMPPRRHSFRGRPRSLTLTRRHSWREPSPDVWSIEEEPEKKTMSEMGLSMEDLEDGQEKKTLPIDIPAAKPRKRVRFLLPDRE